MQGCGKRYSSKPFTKNTEKGVVKNNVTVHAHELSSKESSYYFDADVTKKTGWFSQRPAYQVIHLVVKNDSKDSYILDADDFNVSLANWYDLWEKIVDFRSDIIDQIPYTEMQVIEKDLEQKALSCDSFVTIPPYSQCNKFLFVEKDNASTFFSLALTNEKNGEKTVYEFDL